MAEQVKQLSYEFITVESERGKKMYPMVHALVKSYHPDLKDAKIALAWNLTWKPDKDGRSKIGACKKASELDRQLHGADFIIILKKEFWDHEEVTDHQRKALLDHELSHGTVQLDKDLEPVEDESGRKVFRTVKHDIEEFSAVVARWGCYKNDLEVFAMALDKGRQRELPLAKEA